MKPLRKERLHKMGLNELEFQKSKLIELMFLGKGSRELRNGLYDLLGVMEFKRQCF